MLNHNLLLSHNYEVLHYVFYDNVILLLRFIY